MISVQKSFSRFAAFLLLAATLGLPLSVAFWSHVSNVLPSVGHPTLTADGTLPPPPPQPIKQS
jgi:hypothetical protein